MTPLGVINGSTYTGILQTSHSEALGLLNAHAQIVCARLQDSPKFLYLKKQEIVQKINV